MAKKNVEEKGSPGFEELLAEAEALAMRMEGGGLSLDESLAAYEKGIANLRLCAGLLRGAEEKVKALVERNGVFRLEDLDGEDGDEETEDS
ncbi:MAG: exodeoxyribonuclease VII small subunit [Planctomycetes bacterium]|nr:exodeoxyribonuclease VII small subunit [Planctomycetota bacterium]